MLIQRSKFPVIPCSANNRELSCKGLKLMIYLTPKSAEIQEIP
jgi:hypothetical protein